MRTEPGAGREEPRVGLREPADRDALVDRLLDLVGVLARETKIRLPDDLATLTAHQLEALALLADGDRSIGDLCARLGIAQSAGTALVAKLVARGLVGRHEDPTDRRIVGLHLTPGAAGVVQRFRDLRRERARALLGSLADDQLAELLRIYEAILGAGAARQHAVPRRSGESRRPAEAGGQPAETPSTRKRLVGVAHTEGAR